MIHVASTLHSLVEGAELQTLMLWELGLAQRGGGTSKWVNTTLCRNHGTFKPILTTVQQAELLRKYVC